MSDPGTEVPARRPGRLFVGRHREFETLKASLHAAAGGHGQFVVVVGDAGIGKTRTVEEFVARAGIPEARVLWGRCPEDEGAPAYWPWTQAIRAHVERAERDALRAALGSAAAEVARLLSAVRERLPDVAAVAQAPDPAESRFRLFDGVTTFLQRLATGAPYVLVLDDLHWADEGTMLLLGGPGVLAHHHLRGLRTLCSPQCHGRRRPIRVSAIGVECDLPDPGAGSAVRGAASDIRRSAAERACRSRQ